ncbi:MAG: putative quorum-sensing-regulated virulence factor [Gemmata sp.]
MSVAYKQHRFGARAPREPHIALSPASEYRLTFGKYRGSALGEVPVEYVLWLADCAPAPALRLLAKRFLELDIVLDPDHEFDAPNGDTAAVRLPLVVWSHERALLAQFGDDPATAAGAVVAFSRNELRRLCSSVTGRGFGDVKGGAA